MSIRVDWDNEQHTIIRQTFTPGWTWEEFYRTSTESFAMMTEVSHTVSIISDFRNSGALPRGGAVTQANSVMKNHPANLGILIVVSENTFIHALVNVFRRAYVTQHGRRTFVASNLDEAYQRIRNELQPQISK